MRNDTIAVIGAGPAGLFASYHLLQHSNARVLLLEKGEEAASRGCSVHNCVLCPDVEQCGVLCGVGGGGFFSDGKLVLSLHSGGFLDTVAHLSEEHAGELSEYIEETLKGFDGKSEDGPTPPPEEMREWAERFKSKGLHLKHYRVRHMGTGNLKNIITNFIGELKKSPRFTLLTRTHVVGVSYEANGESIVKTSKGESFSCGSVIFAVGKTGSGWMRGIFEPAGITYKKSPTYLGVRMETPHDHIKELFRYSLDPKIWTFLNGHKVKTHCFCRHGELICSNYLGVPMIGGHTRWTRGNHKPTVLPDKSNFNILVSTSAGPQDILDALRRFREINAAGCVAQSLGAFMAQDGADSPAQGACPPYATPGNIREILSFDGIGDCIAEFILLLGKTLPGVLDRENRLYAPALEWFMDSVDVNPNMETKRPGWYAVGDGAGLSQGIVHASATGILAADAICREREP